MSRLTLALAACLAGCYVAPVQPTTPQPPPGCLDNDRDGFCADIDCDDNDPSIHPNAPDVLADGIDQNCDGYK